MGSNLLVCTKLDIAHCSASLPKDICCGAFSFGRVRHRVKMNLNRSIAMPLAAPATQCLKRRLAF
jgi:hypothetical protein